MSYCSFTPSSSSSSSTNFIATQVLQKTSGPLCVTCFTSVNGTVAGSVHCRMIYGTVPSSVHAWMPPVTTVTYSHSFVKAWTIKRRVNLIKPTSTGATVCVWYCSHGQPVDLVMISSEMYRSLIMPGAVLEPPADVILVLTSTLSNDDGMTSWGFLIENVNMAV